MNLSLNEFLNKLPELAVDELTFTRDRPDSEYGIRSGSWKFRKIGYKEYAVSRLNKDEKMSWHSDQYSGSVCVTGIALGVHGVIVSLGDDYINPLDWD